MEHAISDVPAFRLSVGDPSPVEDEYVFLLVTEGARCVRLLQERMYAGPLAQVEKPLNFVPHMTIGRASDRAALAAAVAEAEASGLGLSGLASTVSVCRVEEHRRRHVEFQVPLRAARIAGYRDDEQAPFPSWDEGTGVLQAEPRGRRRDWG